MEIPGNINSLLATDTSPSHLTHKDGCKSLVAARDKGQIIFGLPNQRLVVDTVL